MKRKYLLIGVVVVLLALPLSYWAWYQSQPGELDVFAQCIADSGAVFYGTFWCPHCQNQKEIFGRSQDLLPYVECSTQDGQGQLAVCADAGITGYPTWVFADGSRGEGFLYLEQLSERTGCPLTQ